MKEVALPDVIKRVIKEFEQYITQINEFRTPVARKLSTSYFRKVKDYSKEEIFKLCELLLELGNNTEPIGWGYRTVGFDWAFKIRNLFAKSDFVRFESWFKKYVKSWDGCDDFCVRALGHIVYMFPELVERTKKWTSSKNRWQRRGAAVSLIYSLRRRRSLSEAFKIAELLLLDQDDMVQKGYGWMLKEASKRFPDEVFHFVVKHKYKMPRTALRYSIEKLSTERRSQAMGKY